MKLTKSELREIIREEIQNEIAFFGHGKTELPYIYDFLEKIYQVKGTKKVNVKKLGKKVAWKFGMDSRKAIRLVSDFHDNYTPPFGK